MENSLNNVGILRLPKKFDLVVGDNFELFYRGIINAIEPGIYDFEISFDGGESLGNAFKRKYEWTPEPRHVGRHIMTVTVRGESGSTVDCGSVILSVTEKPVSPNSEKVVLCVGDSLTRNGVWVSELGRRLTSTGGLPEGYGLKNIRFIGNIEKDGFYYVGTGGWNFVCYNTENKYDKTHIIYGNFDKTEADQHSVYTDADGNHWKLETIEDGKIKVDRILYVTREFPSSGTLTHLYGGINHSPIVYSSEKQTAANPFWSYETGSVDFKRFAEGRGAERIDYCYVLLGWNSTNVPEEEYKAQTREFLDNLLRAFPECKVTLMGIQVPSRDGFGQNYGVLWKYYEKLTFVYEIQRWYSEIADEPKYLGRVEYINVSAQFDTDYNMPFAEFPVNNRNKATEIRQTNGVHPATEGYLQIADAALRNFVARLNEDMD